jgi:hypothetical protein
VSERGSSDTIDADAGTASGPFGGRRRRYVVDARYQLRMGVLVGIVALVLLALLNASMFVQGRGAAGASGMTAHPVAAARDGASLALILLGSGAFLVGVVVIGLLESHRTAGAAFAIGRAVDAIRDGRPAIRVRLRRGDHLQDLARSINRLAETLEVERDLRS